MLRFSAMSFLDNQPIPQNNANATICIFCHQGRESGFTLYRAKLAPGKNSAGSFFNPHYLGTAAMLWGANGYEFSGKSYGAMGPIREPTALAATWTIPPKK